jgi:hypothetical protein
MANLSMKIRTRACMQKSIKMKVDPEDLLKTKGEKSDKMSHADELLKINSLTKTPMSY